MSNQYTDLAYERGDDGVYDLTIESGDLATTRGLETAIFVSLFSDRRAFADEVADPRKRRGWIGDLVADVPGDRNGSGLWLFEQHRLTQVVANGVRLEAEQSLGWMVDQSLIDVASADVSRDGANRQLNLRIELQARDGSSTRTSFVIADATRAGAIVEM